MNDKSVQRTGVVACALWLAVAGSQVWAIVQRDGDDWEFSYTALTVALALAAGLTVWFLAALTRGSARRRLRGAGLAAGALGIAAAAVGAWAIPLWMSLLGISFALMAAAAPEAIRKSIAAAAAAHLVAPAVLVLTIALFEADDGPAGDIVVFATTAVVVAVLASLSRTSERNRSVMIA